MPPTSLHPKSHSLGRLGEPASQPCHLQVLQDHVKQRSNFKWAFKHFHGQSPPKVSTGETGENTPPLVSPGKVLYGILSQLLPEGPASNWPLCGCRLGFSQKPPSTAPVCSLKVAPVIKTKSPTSLWKELVYTCSTRTIFVPPEGLALTSSPGSGSQQHPAFTTTLGPHETKGQFDTKMSAGSTQRELTKLQGSQFLPRRCSHTFSASAQGLGFKLAHMHVISHCLRD